LKLILIWIPEQIGCSFITGYVKKHASAKERLTF